MNASPSTHPRIAAPIPTRPRPAAAMPMPMAASEAVSRFGIRLVRRSMIAAAPMPMAMTATTSASEDLCNGIPEHAADGLSDGCHRSDRRKRYQRDQKSVFEEILAFVAPEPDLESFNQCVHAVCSRAPL